MIVQCFCATVAKVVKRECVLLVTGTRDWWLKMRYTNPNAGTCASHPLPSPKDKCEEKKKTKKVTLELSAASNETDDGKLWFEHSKASFRMLFIFFFRKRKMCICRIKRADVYFARIFAIAMGNNKKCRYGLLLLSERWYWIELECLVFLLCLQMFLEIN